DDETLSILVLVGVIEEDARFGLLFEALQSLPGVQRPTAGLLQILSTAGDDAVGVRTRLRQLLDLGLLQVTNPDAPRPAWALQVPGPIWDAMRGDTPPRPAAWLRHRPAATLAAMDDLVLDDDLRARAARVPDLLAGGAVRAVVVRGPRHNGRRSLLGAVARAGGRGLLEAQGLARPDDERWRLLAPLATLLDALP